VGLIAFDEVRQWGEAFDPGTRTRALAALEAGEVVYLPRLAFEAAADERALFSPALTGRAKNVAFDPATGRLSGTMPPGAAAPLGRMMRRFTDGADGLVRALWPSYGAALARARASFRPAEIAGRVTSWRKDDTRLHVDSFPATPVQGRRILRLFTNVNPGGRPRTWRVGPPFEETAARLLPRLRRPLPGSARLLHLARVTKSQRSEYDALMLQMHDGMKRDAEYQAHPAQTRVEFPAGATWICFTDVVAHAAMAGQYQLEQTFYLPVDAMADPDRSPLRVLERLTGRALV